jgi:hypothetical protein
MFEPSWGSEVGVAVTPGQWHQIKTKIMIDSKSRLVNFRIIYDGEEIKSASTPYTQELPLDGISLYMTSSTSSEGSTFYYDDVWVYTHIAPDTILGADFDRLLAGKTLEIDDDGLSMRYTYAQDSEIIQPQVEAPFYLGEGDQLLRVNSRDFIFDTTGADTTQEYKIGEDYVFELSFFFEDTGDGMTKTPHIRLLYDYWKSYSLADPDWQGGVWVFSNEWDGEEDPLAVLLNPTPNQWHRFAIKYHFDTASKITYSFYYDNITSPLVTVTLDAAIPGEVDFETEDLLSSMGFEVGAEGYRLSEHPMYFNDVMIYRGDIRPWPGKYGTFISPGEHVVLTSSELTES